MMRSGTVARILLVGLVAPLVAACGTTSAAAPLPIVAPTQPGLLPVEQGAVLRFAAAGNPTEQQLYLESIARFEALYPDVRIVFEPANDYQTQMKAQATARQLPDILLVDGELMGSFGPNNLLLPLDDAMGQAGVSADDYFTPTIQLYQLDNKTYGLPKDFNPLVVFVNNELAQAAGVDPATIKTWDDLRAAAAAMTTGEGAGKQYGMCLNPEIVRSGAFVLQTGNQFIANGQAVFNDANGVRAIEFWKSFRDDGTGALFGDLGKGWCGEAFAGRNTAMAIEGGWLIPFLADPANGAVDLPYSAIPLPTPPDGQPATWLFTNGFGVSANTRFPLAASAAVIFFAGEENQRALIPSGLAQPTLRALTDDPYYNDNPVAQVLVEQAQYGQLADTVLGGPVKKGDVLSVLNQAQERIFLGVQPTQAALDQAAEEVNEVLAR